MARVGYDLDGVLYPFVREFTMYLGRRLGVTNIPFASHWHFHRKDWALTDEQFGELMAEAVQSGDLWQNGTPEEGLKEAMWRLWDANHKIVIVTHRELPGIEKKCREVTRDWLRAWNIPYDELIFCDEIRKLGVELDLMLEDRPNAVPSFRLKGVDAVYFTQPWNEKYPYPRVSSVESYTNYVLENYSSSRELSQ